MKFVDYYQALGVPKGASQDEIKRAYRKLARRLHPDVNPGDLTAERRFKEINEANEVLGNLEKRQQYDQLGANWRKYEQGGSSGSPFGSPWGRHGGAGNYRTMSAEEAQDLFGGGSPFSDFFQTFFTGGNKRASSRGTASRGRDAEHPITLTLEEAYEGVTRRLRLATGSEVVNVEVKIPAGVSEGSRVRVAGRGHVGTHGARPGDLYLLVHLGQHSIFTRQDQDLYIDAQTPVTTAVLGGTIEVPRLRGKPLTLRIPAFTKSGQVFRLKGHGMSALSLSRHQGDLYATISILLPDRLTEQQRQHYEALAAIDNESGEPAAGDK